MRKPVGMLISGVAALATLGLTVPAHAGGDYGNHYSDTSIEDVSHVGILSHDEETAFVKVEYTCPEDARGMIAVSLSQNGNHHSDKGGGYGHDETQGTGRRYADCTGYDEEVWIGVEADYGEWQRGDADAKVLLVSKSYGHHSHGDFQKDFEYENIYLVSGHQHY